MMQPPSALLITERAGMTTLAQLNPATFEVPNRINRLRLTRGDRSVVDEISAELPKCIPCGLLGSIRSLGGRRLLLFRIFVASLMHHFVVRSVPAVGVLTWSGREIQ